MNSDKIMIRSKKEVFILQATGSLLSRSDLNFEEINQESVLRTIESIGKALKGKRNTVKFRYLQKVSFFVARFTPGFG